MEKKQKSGKREQESLVPSIKDEEARLDGLLTQARDAAASLLAEADARAAETLRSGRAALPLLVEAERQSRLTTLREKAEEIRQAARGETGALEKTASDRLPGAVRHILSRVWPA